jgi:hypothetical protein
MDMGLKWERETDEHGSCIFEGLPSEVPIVATVMLEGKARTEGRTSTTTTARTMR